MSRRDCGQVGSGAYGPGHRCSPEEVQRRLGCDPLSSFPARPDRGVQAPIDAALIRFAATGHGDGKSLKDRPGELRLRVGKWQVLFCVEPPDFIRVPGIDDRGEAY